MLASSLTGVMLASFLLLPVLMAFINNPRSASGYIFDQMYPAGYYIRFLGSMFSFWAPGDYAYMGFPGIALAAFVVLFSVRDSNLMKYRAAFLIAAAGLCIPAAGYALNGFSYVTTRWIWAFTLIAAYVLVRVWDDMLTPGKVQVRALLICIAVLAVLSLHPSYAGSRINLWISLLAALIWLAAALFGVRHLSALTMLFVCGGVCVNCLFGLVTEWGGMAYGYRSYDRVAGENAEQFNTESAIIRRIEGTGDFYRYSGKGLSGNSSMQDGAPSTQFYWSLANGYVSDFFEEMGLCYSYGNAFAAFDDRTILNEIACVKDFYTQESEHVPYGYTLLGEDVNPAASEYPVYRNRFALSLGTMFFRIVGRTSYEALDPTERQEVLMYAVVADVEGAAEAAVSVVPDAEDAADVEDPTEAAEAAMTDVESTTEAVEAAAADEESTTEAAAADAESTTEAAAADAENAGGTAGTDMEDAAEGITLSRTVQEARISSPDGNIRIDDLTFTVQEDGAKLRVSFEGAPGSETYLYLQDIRYQAAKVPERVPFTVKAYCGKKKVMIRKLSWFTPREEWYVGRNSFLFNSGVQEKNVTSFILTFPFAGVYTFSDLQVYTQPVGEQYEQACAVLRGGALEDVDLHVTPDTTTWASARIDGSIDVDEPGMLLMQLACSGGWSARVDGKIVPVYRADTMFMGIMLEPGPHKITMYYETPGLKAGLLLTLAGLCILPVVKRKEKRRKRSED